MSKGAISLIFILLCSKKLSAQSYIDLISSDYAITPAISFDSSSQETKLHEINAEFTAPIVLTEKTTVLAGLIYENIKADFDPSRGEESLSGFTLKLGLNHQHSDKWSGTYLILPKISSDLNKLGPKDYQLGAVILMKYVKNEAMNYRLGFYSNTERFGPFVVPLFGLYHLNPSKKIETKLLLPLSADVNYSFRKRMRIGLNFKGQVRSFNMSSNLGNYESLYLEKSAKDLYSYVQYAMGNGINLQLCIGRSIGRTYEVYDEGGKFGIPLVYFGDNRSIRNFVFQDSWLFKARLFYRLHLN